MSKVVNWKIQKPLFSSDEHNMYLIYNKARDTTIDNLEVGYAGIVDDIMENHDKVYVKGFIDDTGIFHIIEGSVTTKENW